MIRIKIIESATLIYLDCIKTENGDTFTVTIDKETRKVIDRTTNSDMDISTVYSCICSYLEQNKTLPKEAVAAWG